MSSMLWCSPPARRRSPPKAGSRSSAKTVPQRRRRRLLEARLERPTTISWGRGPNRRADALPRVDDRQHRPKAIKKKGVVIQRWCASGSRSWRRPAGILAQGVRNIEIGERAAALTEAWRS